MSSKRIHDEITQVELKSESFDNYYLKQRIVNENEWSAFISTLKKPLPHCFRISESCSTANRIISYLSAEAIRLKTADKNFNLSPISWYYPKDLAWSMTLSRSELKHYSQGHNDNNIDSNNADINNTNDSFTQFRNYLINQTDRGNITRQEAASMIPVLFLDPKPNNITVDLCAAPGSKTAQLLDLDQSLVIANDSSPSRASMLVHQIERLHCHNTIVSISKAQTYPKLAILNTNDDSILDSENKINYQEKHGNKETGTVLLFDRVLADVPCTGDGTLRKNPLQWNTWKVENGISLHSLQLQIAERASQLLISADKGGLMVYSTCSFNPIENEAVIAELLRRNSDLELVDSSTKVPTLIRHQGLSFWYVPSIHQNNKFYKDFSELETSDKNDKLMSKSLFPPSPDEVKTFHLERCMRILPHHQNTGGFFVAVLRKNSSRETKIINIESKTFRTSANYQLQPYLHIDPSLVDMIKSYYGTTESFPFDQLLFHGNTKKKLYFMSPICASLLTFLSKNPYKLKIEHAGLAAFVKDTFTLDGKKIEHYRIYQDALAYILPFITKQIISTSHDDFLNILKFSSIKLHEKEKLSQSFLDSLASNQRGSVVLVMPCFSRGFIHKPPFAVMAHYGQNSISLMLSKDDRLSLLENFPTTIQQ